MGCVCQEKSTALVNEKIQHLVSIENMIFDLKMYRQ